MTKNRIIGMMLSVVALVLQVVMLFLGPSKDLLFKYLGIATAILAASFSFIYFFKGGTKQYAKWRNLFCIMLTVSLVFSCIKSIQTDKGIINTLCILFTAIIAGCLAFIKDLGKDRSIALASVVLFFQIATILPMFLSGNRIGTVKLLGIASSTLLVFILLSTTYTKYLDKEQRGAK